MTDPTFLIIGGHKCGSTYLFWSLTAHPQVLGPRDARKELHFFDERFARGIDWYRRCFKSGSAGFAVGEATPAYTKGPHAETCATRIASLYPKIKLIFVVRDPIARLASAYAQMIANGSRVRDFDSEVRESPWLIPTSLYWRCLAPYRARFADDQILCLLLEELAAAPEATLRTCFRFLDVPIESVPHTAKRNARTSLVRDRWRFLARARTWNSFEVVRNLIPSGVRARLRVLTKEPLNSDCAWTPSTLTWARDMVRDDAASMLRYCGKPSAFWLLDP